MHAAIGLLMGLYLFALVLIVMNIAAFGVFPQSSSLREQLSRGLSYSRWMIFRRFL
jgi:hypothetical protein